MRGMQSRMKHPLKPSDIFEFKTRSVQIPSASDAATMAGYEFFAVDGKVYRSRDMKTIGPLGDVLESMEGRPSMDALGPADLLGIGFETIEFAVIDNFYATPDRVRQEALASDLAEHPDRHKGLRSSDFVIPDHVKNALATVTGPIKSSFSAWQLNQAGDQRVFHSDLDRWAGLVYLNPDAPPSAGTSFYRSIRAPRVRRSNDLRDLVDSDLVPTVIEAEALVYGGNAILDRTKWTEVDRVGNVYNRLVVWDARLIHSISEPFGYDNESGRLVQLFFWN